ARSPAPRLCAVRLDALSSPSLSLFLYCYVYDRLLPSFPTRRSSDLATCSPCSAANATIRTSRPRMRRSAPSTSAPPSMRGRGPRSEEHTSELQSLTNLVCRLLLEKKKNLRSPQTTPNNPRPQQHHTP